MTPHELWHAVLGELELTLSQANFKTWFGQSQLQSFEHGSVTITVPNGVAKQWLENKYQKQIIHSIERILEQPVQKIIFKIESPAKPSLAGFISQEIAPPAPTQTQPQQTQQNQYFAPTQPQQKSQFITRADAPPSMQTTVTERIEAKNKFGLNPRYTFETFIVGKTNELAHAAAQAIANRPGEVYNPLFIYGGVGLGKTHLIQAIGNRISANDPNVRILYISSERFTNEFVAAIRSGSIKQFM